MFQLLYLFAVLTFFAATAVAVQLLLLFAVLAAVAVPAAASVGVRLLLLFASVAVPAAASCCSLQFYVAAPLGCCCYSSYTPTAAATAAVF